MLDPEARDGALGPVPDRLWLTAAVLGVSGFAALLHEIAWTRILALVIDPTTYAFAATLAGREVPLLVARQLAATPVDAGDWVLRSAALTATLILPTALCLGASFPLALAVAGATASDITGRFGIVYAANTIGAVSGSLAAGFIVIPRFGLQTTLQIVSGCLVA